MFPEALRGQGKEGDHRLYSTKMAEGSRKNTAFCGHGADKTANTAAQVNEPSAA